MTPDTRRMEPLATEAVALLKSLAHPARLMICCQLRGGEMSVSELERVLDIRQPRLSRELAKLREEGLVEGRRDAKTVFYQLASDKAHALIDALCAIMFGKPAAQPGLVPAPSETPPKRPGG